MTRTRIAAALILLAATSLAAALHGRSADATTPLHQESMPNQSQQQVKTIRIVAKRFGFTPDKVTLKKGEPVKLEFVSEDVVHGMYVKPLKLDTDIQPGKVGEVMITPTQAGTFTAICDHFCGAGHGNMKMTYVVEE